MLKLFGSVYRLLNAENRTVLFGFILKRNSRIITEKDDRIQFSISKISRLLRQTSVRYTSGGVHVSHISYLIIVEYENR
uniref:Uncharacterized protein n=1 Tax=Trichobilharzia regenti TaxID=157069 RepID=A0AA85J1V2_TRIRE|nr:unnamed protein product [Trichobilharzia regenti]